METLRTFIAIHLPAHLLTELESIQHTLAGRVPVNRVRWVNTAGIHLTLKFLGETPVERLPEIYQALETVARHATGGDFILQGVGCFPNTKRPRVIWAGVAEGPPTGWLTLLQQAVEEAMTNFGYPPERRPFHPHLTLGRVKKGVPSGDVARIGAVVADTAIGQIGQTTAERFAIIRSVLKPSGAEYTTLKEFPLCP